MGQGEVVWGRWLGLAGALWGRGVLVRQGGSGWEGWGCVVFHWLLDESHCCTSMMFARGPQTMVFSNQARLFFGIVKGLLGQLGHLGLGT